jgi:hypothetical protein
MTTSPLRLFADRAASTLAGGISPTSVTLNLTAGGGALFPNPTAPNFFAATLIDAATGLLDEIVWCTGRVTDTLTVIRAQEGTEALTFNAGDLFQKLLTSGDMESMLQSDQLFVPATTFFVNGTTGSDSNTGTSATLVAGTNIGPFQTLQGAESVISQFFSANAITVNVAAGTYAGISIGSSLISNWLVNGSGPTTCHIVSSNGDVTNGVCFSAANSAHVTAQGFSFTGSQAGIVAQEGASIIIGTNNFGACGGSGCIVSNSGANLSMFGLTPGATAAYTFTGASSILWNVFSGGTIQVGFTPGGGGGSNLAAITFSSSSFSDAVAAVTQGGSATFQPAEITFSGTPTGVRFSLGNGTISTNGSGLTYIPGTSAGVFAAALTTAGVASTIAQGVYT